MNLLDEQPVVLLTGISASGKSTVGEQLARRFTRGVHVRGDIFRRMVVSGRHDMTAEPSDEAFSQLRLRYRLGAATADRYQEAGFSVVVQDVVIGPMLAEYIEAIRSRPLVLVVLTPRADVVARRETERAKVAYREDSATIEQLDQVLRHQTPSIGLWIDNSDQRPDETVDEIIERGLDVGSID